LQNSNPDDDGLERNAVSLGARYQNNGWFLNFVGKL
jgi:hypothetical protein